MVHCWEDNAMLAGRYDQLNTMNTYNYTGQQQHDQYSNPMGNTDTYSPYQVNYSDPNIQQLAQSASWAGVYAARSGHGAIAQGTSALLEDWSNPTHQSYCGSSNSDSSPSPNGYSYPIQYRTNLTHNSGDYSVPSPGNLSPAPTGHGNVVSVIASHQSHPGDRSSCQAGQSGIRPLRPPYDWMKRQTYQSVPSAGKTRTKDKYRVVYTDHQRLELEKEFHYSRYITIRRKAELAQSLNLSERQVKIWFQNRRAKERKQKKKEDAKGAPDVQLHEQAITLAQSVQMDIKPQTSLPLSDLSQSQTPHLSHTTLQSPDMVRQEEVPNSSAMEVLRP